MFSRKLSDQIRQCIGFCFGFLDAWQRRRDSAARRQSKFKTGRLTGSGDERLMQLICQQRIGKLTEVVLENGCYRIYVVEPIRVLQIERLIVAPLKQLRDEFGEARSASLPVHPFVIHSCARIDMSWIPRVIEQCIHLELLPLRCTWRRSQGSVDRQPLFGHSKNGRT